MIKLQHLTVIFIIIMIPLILVLSNYISIQIETINEQTKYNTKLNDATHDAMEAFQINSRNNEFSTMADSLKRDVAAAVNTFYTSLASNMGISGMSRAELQPYIPAVLCTMYDGYYISSPTPKTFNNETEDILKQYIYYTARYYKNEYNNVTINYSLDSYISVYGIVNGNYIAKSGYLIQYGAKGLTEINGEEVENYKVYNPSTKAYIGSGTAGYIKDGVVWEDENKQSRKDITSVTYKGKVIETENNVITKNIRAQYIEESTSTDAIDYFISAYEFSKYINEMNLNDIVGKIGNGIQISTNGVDITNEVVKLDKVFDLNEDPENLQSDFVNHKRDIIRLSIEKNLGTAFNNFEGIFTYDYELPKLADDDWDKIFKNVSIVTFMQGIQVGNKIYNNYSIVTSTGNEEYVDPEEIYFINNTSNTDTYHRIGCSITMNENWIGYRSNMYLQQNKIVGKSDSNDESVDKTNSGYILHEIGNSIKTLTAHYTCMINGNYTSVYNNDGELLGDITDNTKKTLYYTALARERNCLKKTRVTNVILNAVK